MFNLRDFIKKGLLDAVGKMPDYQVILTAAGWHEKRVLDESDLAEIEVKIEAKNNTNRPTSMDDLNAEEA
jgi:transketolase